MRGDMAYIRDYYGVPAKRGGRVRYTYLQPDAGRPGTILSASEGKLWIRFDDEPWHREGPFHPTWELEYEGLDF